MRSWTRLRWPHPLARVLSVLCHAAARACKGAIKAAAAQDVPQLRPDEVSSHSSVPPLLEVSGKVWWRGEGGMRPAGLSDKRLSAQSNKGRALF